MEHEPDDERPLLHSTRLPPAATAEAGSPQDDHETRAQELRNALEELKADLDGRGAPSRPATVPGSAATTSILEPPGAPSTRSAPAQSTQRSGQHRRSRVALGALAAVLVLAAVTGVVRVVAWSVAGARNASAAGGSASTQPWPASSPSASLPSASVPSASAPTASAAGTPAAGGAPAGTPSPPGPPAVALPPGLPRTGPGVDAPGSETTALLEGGGSVVVYERLVVRAGVTAVHLAPAHAQTLPRDLQDVGFTVTGLRAAVDGRGVTPARDSAGWRVTAPGGAPFSQVVLRYRLARAVVRSTPAPPGRGTLVLRPLTGGEASRAQDPVVVRLRDPRVGQVYCPAGSQPLCDTPRGLQHVATVPAGVAAVVLAQVDPV